jgi:hypothetical protein
VGLATPQQDPIKTWIDAPHLPVHPCMVMPLEEVYKSDIRVFDLSAIKLMSFFIE